VNNEGEKMLGKAVEPNSNAWLIPNLGISHAFEWREMMETTRNFREFQKGQIHNAGQNCCRLSHLV